MKKFKSISLIETLISLAIVGISMTALLPVMTVKKEATDPGKGNSYWMCEDSGGETVECTNGNARVLKAKDSLPVGVGKAPNNRIPPILVDATGFKNQGLAPLRVQNNLQYLGQMVSADANSLRISSDSTNKNTSCGTTNSPTTNFYVGDKGVIIESNSSQSEITNVCLEYDTDGSCKTSEPRDTQFSFCQNGATTFYNNKQIPNNGTVYAMKRNNEEYINITHLPAEADPPAILERTLIGIGENALRPFNERSNVVAIADNTFINGAATEFNGLIIGNITTTTPSTTQFNYTTGYVISQKAGEQININAGLNVGNGAGTITATAYIIQSDKNLKDILGKYTKGIDEILKIKPVNFTYKSDEKQTQHVGVVAQDLKKVFPESVSVNHDTGYLMVNTDGIFYALLNSIKALNKKNEELAKQNEELENKIAQLRIIRDRLRAEKGGQNE